ncbi:hypothetical protein PQX77_017069 [Marasmius sp. AFHP31]|nr:hypothetical protein PQX77_017069 [Marasmius sp. AFHP31]
MLRTLLYLSLTFHSCIGFKISADPTITVGALATATWSKGLNDEIVGIRLIECEPTQSLQIDLGPPTDMMKPSGTVNFTVPKIGKYRLESFSESGEPGCNNVPGPGGNMDSRQGDGNGHSYDGYPYGKRDHYWQNDRHIEGRYPDGGGWGSDDGSKYEDDDQNHSPGVCIEIIAVASPVDPNRTAKIIGSVLGTLLFLLILAFCIYLYRRRRRESRVFHKEAGSSTSFESDRMMVSNRPWHQSPAYSSPRAQARSEYNSDSASTSDSTYSSSDSWFSSIAPSDSVSQIRCPSQTYNFHVKRKPLRTSTDLSTISETRGSEAPSSIDSSTLVSGSEAPNRPKPVFPHPIPVITTTSATPQSSVVS